MMNFFHSYSTTPILGVLVLYILLMCIYKEAYIYHSIIDYEKKIFGLFLILVLCMYAVQDTDYFHYMQELERIRLGYFSNMEDVYVSLAKYVNYEYVPFRFIIWGSAVFLFVLTIRRIDQSVSLVLFYFVSMYLLRFSYARVSLAMAMGLLGFTFLIKPISKTIISYVLGLFIIYCSTFFHKSAIVWFIIFPLSLIKLDKKTLFISLIIYPLIIYLFNNFVINYIMIQESDWDVINSAQSYANAGGRIHGISGIIRNLLNYTPYYLSLLLVVFSVLRDEYSLFCKSEQLMINVSFFTIYIATIFFFNTTQNTYVIFYRILYFSILPLSILFSIYKSYDMYPRLVNMCLGFGVCLCIYELFYSIYISSLLIP